MRLTEYTKVKGELTGNVGGADAAVVAAPPARIRTPRWEGFPLPQAEPKSLAADGAAWADDQLRFGRILMEIMLGLALISLVNMLFFRQTPGFLGVSPHPYWLVAAFIPVRYGFAAGVAAGLASGLLYVGFALWETPDISLMDMRRVAFWGAPVAFVLGGALLGEIRQSQREVAGRLRDELHNARRAGAQLQRRHAALVAAKEEVDARLSLQSRTLATLYEGAQALRSLDESAICPAALDLLHDYVGATRSSIYLLEGEALALAAWKGGGAPPPAFASHREGTMAAAVRHGRTQSLNVALYADRRRDDILVSAPIRHGVTGAVLGVMNVEDAPFLKFNQMNVELTSLLADWCGASLANAREHQAARARLILDDDLHAYTPAYLDLRLQEEFQRAARYGLPLAVLALRLRGLEAMSPEARASCLRAFSSAVKAKVRALDLLFLRDHEGGFALVTPNTPKEGAAVVARAIMAQYAEHAEALGDGGVVLGGGVAAMEEQHPDATAMLAAAAQGADHET